MSKTSESSDTLIKLTLDDLAFIAAYFEENMNGTRTYAKLHPNSGYDSSRSSAATILAKPNIRAEIRRRLEEGAMSAEEGIYRLGEMGRAELHPFIEIDDDGFVWFNFADPEAKRYLFLIKKIKTKRERRVEGKGDDAQEWEGEWVEVELHDAHAAVRDVLKLHGRFAEKPNPAINTDPQPLSIPAELIAPDFLSAYRDIKDKRHTEYLFYGGRGSTKSSFVSLAIVYLIVNNPAFHALITRQVKDTLRDSVYSQMTWAIDQLGFTDSFKCTTSPLEIRYIPTGQTIFFRGGDEPGKIKSIKPPFGAIAILWLEELDQFKGAEAVRKIEQSAIRGTDDAYIFKSFNPPRTQNAWVNKYAKIPKATQYQHFSNFLTVPREWLGQAFLDEAEHLKAVAPDTYDHEYMGVANSAGSMIFENVTVRKIEADEIKEFDRIHHGVDWGYYPDAWQWDKMHYDSARRKLYIFDELRLYKRSNQETYNALVKEKGVIPQDSIIADSAEPKSVGDYRAYGLSCRGAEKGPDSVNYSIKWLQGLTEIVIDNERCPYTAEEFLSYEYERDKNDEIISGYPDKNDHAIAATRYGMNLEWRRRGQ